MQYMLGLKNSLIQALWQLTILANVYLPLERFIDRFYYQTTNFDRLEE